MQLAANGSGGLGSGHGVLLLRFLGIAVLGAAFSCPDTFLARMAAALFFGGSMGVSCRSRPRRAPTLLQPQPCIPASGRLCFKSLTGSMRIPAFRRRQRTLASLNEDHARGLVAALFEIRRPLIRGCGKPRAVLGSEARAKANWDPQAIIPEHGGRCAIEHRFTQRRK